MQESQLTPSTRYMKETTQMDIIIELLKTSHEEKTFKR